MAINNNLAEEGVVGPNLGSINTATPGSAPPMGPDPYDTAGTGQPTSAPTMTPTSTQPFRIDLPDAPEAPAPDQVSVRDPTPPIPAPPKPNAKDIAGKINFAQEAENIGALATSGLDLRRATITDQPGLIQDFIGAASEEWDSTKMGATLLGANPMERQAIAERQILKALVDPSRGQESPDWLPWFAQMAGGASVGVAAGIGGAAVGAFAAAPLAGAAVGAGAQAGLSTFAQVYVGAYNAYLREHPNNRAAADERAYNDAMKASGVSGLINAAGTATGGLRVFAPSSKLLTNVYARGAGNVAGQVFAIQPGTMVADQVTQNILAQKSWDRDRNLSDGVLDAWMAGTFFGVGMAPLGAISAKMRGKSWLAEEAGMLHVDETPPVDRVGGPTPAAYGPEPLPYGPQPLPYGPQPLDPRDPSQEAMFTDAQWVGYQKQRLLEQYKTARDNDPTYVPDGKLSRVLNFLDFVGEGPKLMEEMRTIDDPREITPKLVESAKRRVQFLQMMRDPLRLLVTPIDVFETNARRNGTPEYFMVQTAPNGEPVTQTGRGGRVQYLVRNGLNELQWVDAKSGTLTTLNKKEVFNVLLSPEASRMATQLLEEYNMSQQAMLRQEQVSLEATRGSVNQGIDTAAADARDPRQFGDKPVQGPQAGKNQKTGLPAVVKPEARSLTLVADPDIQAAVANRNMQAEFATARKALNIGDDSLIYEVAQKMLDQGEPLVAEKIIAYAGKELQIRKQIEEKTAALVAEGAEKDKTKSVEARTKRLVDAINKEQADLDAEREKKANDLRGLEDIQRRQQALDEQRQLVEQRQQNTRELLEAASKVTRGETGTIPLDALSQREALAIANSRILGKDANVSKPYTTADELRALGVTDERISSLTMKYSLGKMPKDVADAVHNGLILGRGVQGLLAAVPAEVRPYVERMLQTFQSLRGVQLSELDVLDLAGWLQRNPDPMGEQATGGFLGDWTRKVGNDISTAAVAIRQGQDADTSLRAIAHEVTHFVIKSFDIHPEALADFWRAVPDNDPIKKLVGAPDKYGSMPDSVKGEELVAVMIDHVLADRYVPRSSFFGEMLRRAMLVIRTVWNDITGANEIEKLFTGIERKYQTLLNGIDGITGEQRKGGAGALFKLQDSNPIPLVPDKVLAERYAAKENARSGTGTPKNQKVMLPNGLLVGNITTADLMSNVMNFLGKEEIATASNWYRDLPTWFKQFYGNSWAKELIAWAAANQNVSPESAVRIVARVKERVETGKVGPKGGVSDDNVEMILYDTGSSANLGVKLTDFIDASLGRNVRRWFNDEARGGEPAVIDIHAISARGYIREANMNAIRKTYGDEVAAKLELDFPRGAPHASQYEAVAQWYRDATASFNRQKFMGRDNWTASEVQAVAWVATQKAYGDTPTSVKDMFDLNTRNISFELAPANDSPAMRSYGDRYQNLPLAQQRMVSAVALDWSIEKLLGDFSLVRRDTDAKDRPVMNVYALGGYEGFSNISRQLKVFGTDYGVKNFARALGTLLQQTEVWVSRPHPQGKTLGIDVQIPEAFLRDDGAAIRFWNALREGEPELIKGYHITDRNLDESAKVPSMRIIMADQALPGRKANPESVQKAIMDTYERVARAAEKAYGVLGMDPGNFDVSWFRMNVEKLGNDWSTQPHGEGYLEGYDAGNRSDLFERLRGPYRSEFEQVVSDAIGVAERSGVERTRGQGEPTAGRTGEVAPSVPMDRPVDVRGHGLEAGPAAQADIYSRFGTLSQDGGDTTHALKVYNLSTFTEAPERVQTLAAKYKAKVELFSFHEDAAAGVAVRIPRLNEGYSKGTVWIYDPRVADGSFKDELYTSAWRVSHEIAHGITESVMARRYGPSRRYGRLGQTMEGERGAAGKRVTVTLDPLTLSEAQRAVEWEDVAFRAQRIILEKEGVRISDEEFAREYNINLSDAVYRVTTGKFGNPGEYGFSPSTTKADLKNVLYMVEDAERTLSQRDERAMTQGVALDVWEPISDAEIRIMVERAGRDGMAGSAVDPRQFRAGLEARTASLLADPVRGQRIDLNRIPTRLGTLRSLDANLVTEQLRSAEEFRARAEAAGFNTERHYYVGTPEGERVATDRVGPGDPNQDPRWKYGRSVYASTSEREATHLAYSPGDNGSTIIPKVFAVYLRNGKTLDARRIYSPDEARGLFGASIAQPMKGDAIYDQIAAGRSADEANAYLVGRGVRAILHDRATLKDNATGLAILDPADARMIDAEVNLDQVGSRGIKFRLGGVRLVSQEGINKLVGDSAQIVSDLAGAIKTGDRVPETLMRLTRVLSPWTSTAAQMRAFGTRSSFLLGNHFDKSKEGFISPTEKGPITFQSPTGTAIYGDYHSEVDAGLARVNGYLRAIDFMPAKAVRTGLADALEGADPAKYGLNATDVDAVRQGLDKTYDYLRRAMIEGGADPSEVPPKLKNYFPHIYRLEGTFKEGGAAGKRRLDMFERFLQSAGFSETASQNVVMKISHEDMIPSWGFDFARILGERTYALSKQEQTRFINMDPLKKHTVKLENGKTVEMSLSDFLFRDPFLVLDRYIATTVRRAEFVRRFGTTGKALNEIVDRIAAETAAKGERFTTNDRTRLFTLMKANVGMLGTDAVRNHPVAFQAQNVVKFGTNIALLTMSTIASLPEYLSVAQRLGMNAQLHALSVGIREVLRAPGAAVRAAGKAADAQGTTFDKFRAFAAHYGMDNSDIRQFATDIGVIVDHMVQSIHNSAEANITRWTDRATNMFFKGNLLQPVTEHQRVTATAAAVLSLAQWARKASDPKYAEYLRDVGLTPADLKSFDPNRPRETSNPAINAAVRQIVDQIIIEPNAAKKPAWMSDPRLGLFSQISGYVTAFNNTILQRAVREAVVNWNPTPMLYLAGYAAVGAMVYEMYQWWKWGEEGNPYMKKLGLEPGDPKRFMLIMGQRGGLFGPFEKPIDLLLGTRVGRQADVGGMLSPALGVLNDLTGGLANLFAGFAVDDDQAVRRGVEGLLKVTPGLAAMSADQRKEMIYYFTGIPTVKNSKSSSNSSLNLGFEGLNIVPVLAPIKLDGIGTIKPITFR